MRKVTPAGAESLDSKLFAIQVKTESSMSKLRAVQRRPLLRMTTLLQALQTSVRRATSACHSSDPGAASGLFLKVRAERGRAWERAEGRADKPLLAMQLVLPAAGPWLARP